MNDPTEAVRRLETARINAVAGDRATMEAKYGQVWNTEEVQKDFQILGFKAPYVTAVRRVDGAGGRLEFQHAPRFYFNFIAD